MSENKDKDFLLIIDGSSLLSTQFFGNLPKEIMFAKTTEEKARYFSKIMHTSSGVYTNAVYGFIRVLLKIIKDQKPTYLAIAWDVSRDTFRREIYPDYKGNRGETLEPLSMQFALCQEVLEKMGVKQFMDSRYEADDFSGSLCQKFEQEVPVRILTKDNDYLQLITEQTNLWLLHSTAKKTEELYEKYGLNQKQMNAPDRTFLFNPDLMVQEFGVEPDSIPSLKGIQGDSSDNIKGVPGVGEASAVALIKEYKTVEQLYDAIRDLDEEGKKKISEYWKTIGIKRTPINALLKTSDTELVGEQAAMLSKRLATIKKDIELSVNLEDLRIHIQVDKAQQVCDELEFKTIKVASFLAGQGSEESDGFASMSDLEIAQDLFGTSLNKEEEVLFETKVDYKESFDRIMASQRMVTKVNEADEVFDEIVANAEQLSVVSLKTIIEGDCLFALSLVISDQKAVCFVVDEISTKYLQNQLRRLVEADITFVTLNLKQQLSFLPFDQDCDVFDTAIAAYLLEPDTSTYEYDYIASNYLELTLSDQAVIMNKHSYSELRMFDETSFQTVVGIEAAISYLAYPLLLDKLTKASMLALFETIEMPLIYTLYDMEQRGIRVNKEALREYGAQLASGIATLEQDIYRMVGEEFNINSPKQLGVILFEKLKLPNGKKTKTGYSTSADVLEKLKIEDPVIEKILEYRQLTKLKSTYADGLAAYVKEDGRIHGTFNQTIAATGRISSTEPNLQNIPIRMELGRKIRKVFIPEDGYLFLDADYSQIELRVLAHMSQDERLIDAYRHGHDIHRLTASQVFHTPFDEVSSAQRSNAKAVNFGIVYGISAFSLAEDLKIKKKEADEYIEKYFETYPNVKIYLDNLVSDGREYGYVTTMFGRIRRLPDMKHSNFNVRSGQERIAMNSPIQGTAADIIKIAMIRVNDALKQGNLKSRLLLQIHDELLVEAHLSEVEEVKALMKQEMEAACELLVPLTAEVNAGSDWYEAK
jgi:DNA polymerase-1